MKDIKINSHQMQKYIKEGYWTDKTLLDYWNNSVSKYGDSEFLVDDKGCRYTYAEADEKASIIAGYFKEINVKPNDVISFQLPVWSEFVLICVACMKVGGIINPIGRRYDARELEYLLNLTQSKIFICPTWFRDKNYEERILSVRDKIKSLKQIILLDNIKEKETETITLKEILNNYRPLENDIQANSNDIAAILCTSGTTGGIKGVMLTHNNIIFSEQYFAKGLGLTQADIMFMAAPLHHATGFHHGIILPMLLGGKVVFQGKFKADDAVKIMNQEKCTYSMGSTPFIYDILEDLKINGGSLETLKFYLCGGAPVPGNMVQKANEYGIKLCEVYGSTESVPHVFVRPEEALTLMGSTSGRSMEGVEIRIVNEKGEDVPLGTVGEEISRGPNVFVGYLNDRDSTDKALDNDGWFYSGDLCVGDEFGNIKIIGRKKDMIVRGGENLNSNQICEYIIGCPEIQDQAVIGMPDERLGERICAYVVLKKGIKSLELIKLLEYLDNKGIPKQYWPERLEIIDKIPRTDSGKVKKYLLYEDIKKKLLSEGKKVYL